MGKVTDIDNISDKAEELRVFLIDLEEAIGLAIEDLESLDVDDDPLEVAKDVAKRLDYYYQQM